MGYRSEVVFAVAPPLVDKFLAVMAASEKVRDLVKYNEAYKQGIQFGFYNEGDIVVNLDGIKWYEEFASQHILPPETFEFSFLTPKPNGGCRNY